MSGDKDPARGEVKASVPLVVRGVTKKHTTSRAGCQLVRSSGGDVRITCTPEDTEVVIAGRGTEKSMVRSGSRRSRGRKAVEQVGGGVEALSPEAWGTSFVVRIIRSALPFWGEVYEQDIRS